MNHVDKYVFYFATAERANSAINDINDIFCKALNLCLSSSCGCEIGKGEKICKTYKISEGLRPVTVNEGPDWTMVYVQLDNSLILHFYYYGPKVDIEMMALGGDLSKFQYTEAISDRTE